MMYTTGHLFAAKLSICHSKGAGVVLRRLAGDVKSLHDVIYEYCILAYTYATSNITQKTTAEVAGFGQMHMLMQLMVKHELLEVMLFLGLAGWHYRTYGVP